MPNAVSGSHQRTGQKCVRSVYKCGQLEHGLTGKQWTTEVRTPLTQRSELKKLVQRGEGGRYKEAPCAVGSKDVARGWLRRSRMSNWRP